MTTIILLNGPPRSGKDMAATFLRKDIRDCTDFKMSKPLKDAFQAMFALTDMQRHNMCETEQKDIPQDMLHGMTPRQVLIQISEDFIKPRFGVQFFGEVMVRRLRNSPAKIVTISDSGFTDECIPLIKAFGKENIFGITLEREGSNYAGDSRKDVDYASLGILHTRINNRYDLEMFRVQLWRALRWIPDIKAKLEAL